MIYLFHNFHIFPNTCKWVSNLFFRYGRLKKESMSQVLLFILLDGL
jgi:hypothetical protein